MNDSPRRFSRALLSLCVALVLALYGAPASAHGRHGGEAEAEVDGLEVEARPAIVKAGHPVLIKAELESDDDADESDEDERSEEADESDDDSDEDDSDDDDSDEDDSDEDSDDDDSDEDDSDEDDSDEDDSDEDDSDEDDSDEDDADTQSATLMRRGADGDDRDDSDDADTEDCDDDTDDSDEDDSDDDSDDDESDEDDSDDDDSELQRRGHCDDVASATVFTIDFGDDSAPATMEGRGHGDDARAHIRHVYAAEGVYDVTVTATRADGSSVEATVSVQVGKGAGRLSGKDRFETGTKLSHEAFPEDRSASAVVLARADGFADALASAGLATLRKAPVLLTSTAELPADVLEELQRVLVAGGTVFVLGGESAISADVATQLEGLGYVVERISGTDRIATALQVAKALQAAGAEFDEVVLANAGNFPDALSGAAHAAKRGVPVLLTPGDALDPRVRDFLAALGEDVKVLVAGGPSVISPEIVAELEAMGLDVKRKGGRNRFATSAVIAADEFPDATSVVIATGKTFPDALAGAAHAGRLEAPVLLVGDELSDEVRAYLEAGAGRINVVYVIGGPNAVSEHVMAEIMEILDL